MLTSLSSNAIAAKARAIYGKRLTNLNYTELSRLTTVSDVCAYLKSNTNYAKYLKGVDESGIHRGQLENLIKRSVIDKYFSLLHYDFSTNKGFYGFVITNVETTVILHAIMFMNSGSSDDFISTIPAFLQEYIHFDLKALSKANNFDQLLEVLKQTPYFAVLKIYNASNGNINFKDCELALKTYYYKWTLEQISKSYKGKAQKELLDIVKSEIELLNISLIYRLKFYFKKPPEIIKSQIISIYYKLSKRSIEELIDLKTREDFIQKVKIYSHNPNSNDIDNNYIEDYTKRLRFNVNRKMMRSSTNAAISFYSLMTLMQIEIENIIIIIEGVRYNENDTEIQKLLILE